MEPIHPRLWGSHLKNSEILVAAEEVGSMFMIVGVGSAFSQA
jgi:hypothetical protein